MYTQAIAGADRDGSLFCNRSAAFLAMGLFNEAKQDALKAVKLDSSNPKAYYRQVLDCS